MLTIDRYAVNHLTSFLIGERNKYGYLYTRVVEGDQAFLVRMTPREVLEYTLLSVGSDLRGAMKSARSILDNGYMCPIIVNPYQDICLFPTHSSRADHCMWVNPKRVVNYDNLGIQTSVYFKDYIIIPVDLLYITFKTRKIDAHRLLDITKENGYRVRDIASENHKHFHVVREDMGVYNFEVFNEMEDQDRL